MKGSAVHPQRSCEIRGQEERRERKNLFSLSHFTEALCLHLMWFMRVHVQNPDAAMVPVDLWCHQGNCKCDVMPEAVSAFTSRRALTKITEHALRYHNGAFKYTKDLYL